MEQMETLQKRHLSWTEPFSRVEPSTLTAEGEVLGSMYWGDTEGNVVILATPRGRWRIIREGSFGATIRIENVEGSKEPAFLYKSKWTGKGTLLCPDGNILYWVPTALWKCDWAFTDGTGKRLLCFSANFHMFKGAAMMETAPGVGALPAYPLLVLFGWYLMSRAGAGQAVAETGCLHL